MHLEQMHANALQRQLQQEFVDITEKSYAHYTPYTKDAMILNARLIDIGVDYTRQNYIAHACIISDCCTKILTDIEQWTQTLPYSLQRVLVYTAAIAQGVADGVINSAAYIAHHPIEFALTAAIPEIMVPYHIGRITLSALSITYNRLADIDYQHITTDTIKAKFDQLYDEMKNIDGPQFVRHATALGTQLLIDGKIAYASNAACKKAITKLAEEIGHIKNARSFSFALAGDMRTPKIIVHANEDIEFIQKYSQNLTSIEIEKVIDTEKFIKAVEHATTERKLEHFFNNPNHGFNSLLNTMGGAKNVDTQKKLVKKVIEELMKTNKIPYHPEGIFEGVSICVGEEIIHAKGRICDEIIKLGTIFIPSRYVPKK